MVKELYRREQRYGKQTEPQKSIRSIEANETSRRIQCDSITKLVTNVVDFHAGIIGWIHKRDYEGKKILIVD